MEQRIDSVLEEQQNYLNNLKTSDYKEKLIKVTNIIIECIKNGSEN